MTSTGYFGLKKMIILFFSSLFISTNVQAMMPFPCNKLNTKIKDISKLNMNTNTIFDFSVKDYQNNLVSLQDFKDNKAVLVVNVASY